jgi:hypothetical protein
MRLNTDIFLITYPGDYPWLQYLLRSTTKYVTGFDRLCVVVEEGDDPPTDILKQFCTAPWYIEKCRRYRGTDYWGKGGQQIEKMRAWAYTDAERILLLDSDCVWIRPIDLQTDPAICIEKPVILHTPWENVGDARCWYSPTKTILGFEPPAETMRRHPFCYPAWFMHKVWEHVGGEERLRQFEHPCEFNVLGNYAMVNHSDDFTLLQTMLSTGNEQRADSNIDGIPTAPIRQFWSVGGMNDRVRQEIEAAIARGTT